MTWPENFSTFLVSTSLGTGVLRPRNLDLRWRHNDANRRVEGIEQSPKPPSHAYASGSDATYLGAAYLLTSRALQSVPAKLYIDWLIAEFYSVPIQLKEISTPPSLVYDQCVHPSELRIPSLFPHCFHGGIVEAEQRICSRICQALRSIVIDGTDFQGNPMSLTLAYTWLVRSEEATCFQKALILFRGELDCDIDARLQTIASKISNVQPLIDSIKEQVRDQQRCWNREMKDGSSLLESWADNWVAWMNAEETQKIMPGIQTRSDYIGEGMRIEKGYDSDSYALESIFAGAFLDNLGVSVVAYVAPLTKLIACIEQIDAEMNWNKSENGVTSRRWSSERSLSALERVIDFSEQFEGGTAEEIGAIRAHYREALVAFGAEHIVGNCMQYLLDVFDQRVVALVDQTLGNLASCADGEDGDYRQEIADLDWCLSAPQVESWHLFCEPSDTRRWQGVLEKVSHLQKNDASSLRRNQFCQRRVEEWEYFKTRHRYGEVVIKQKHSWSNVRRVLPASLTFEYSLVSRMPWAIDVLGAKEDLCELHNSVCFARPALLEEPDGVNDEHYYVRGEGDHVQYRDYNDLIERDWLDYILAFASDENRNASLSRLDEQMSSTRQEVREVIPWLRELRGRWEQEELATRPKTFSEGDVGGNSGDRRSEDTKKDSMLCPEPESKPEPPEVLLHAEKEVVELRKSGKWEIQTIVRPTSRSASLRRVENEGFWAKIKQFFE
ncbi:MAG: hypothetical protein NT023_05700 [Armatimonadetes bacterium]|nr:hypothetical protein [Armatimonadota bacterium]